MQLLEYIKTLSPETIKQYMMLSDKKAQETYELIQGLSENSPTLPAIDIFLGDIYSGLQAQTFSSVDREYANTHLFILSGLYGILRALDDIRPYRLEMGYKLPGNAHDLNQPNVTSLYEFWGDAIARQLPQNQPIINLSAKEYTKDLFKRFEAVTHHSNLQIISPKFLTVSSKTGQPTFVTVHAKIARGAFARWLIQQQIEDVAKLHEFNEIGYEYSPGDSTPVEPVFIAKKFKGLGLSIRLN